MRRSGDNIKWVKTGHEDGDCIQLAQDGVQWLEVVKLRVPLNGTSFLLSASQEGIC
jgi:hypothetical protein